MLRKYIIPLGLLAALSVPVAFASEGAETHGAAAISFLWIGLLLIFAKVSSLIERIGQPSVLGELLIGVLLGNLVLMGLPVFEPIKENATIAFLAELGVVILLFQIGLESNIKEMSRVGLRAFLVACLGVLVPFLLGYYVGPMLMPELSKNAAIFLGATLTATSVGITARVFKDLGKLKSKESQIVLGAAVIDDVLGLIILAAVSAIVTAGSAPMSMIAWIIAKAILFLVGAIFLGQILAPYLGRAFSKIHTGVAMKFTLAISFGLIMAYLAAFIGLAPIVGAFAAGLVLDPVHFRYFKDPKIVHHLRELLANEPEAMKEKIMKEIEPHAHRHIDELVEPVGHFLVPIFFVMTGINVKLETLFNPQILMVALAITGVAFAGKLIAGLVAGKVNKWIVGVGMVPRGEVGLIFAMIGKTLGVVNDEIFSVIVIVVILTTLLTPPLLAWLLKKQA